MSKVTRKDFDSEEAYRWTLWRFENGIHSEAGHWPVQLATQFVYNWIPGQGVVCNGVIVEPI